jgi:DNA polymerase II large subunit
VTSFKDGTVRYDMTDLPVTSVRASELDVTVDDLRELGYDEDIDGQPLRHEDQLVELRVQDIVLSDGAAEHMLKTADFVDDLLERFYGLEPFYEVEDREDLVGELVFGMAPHTSAATVGRVIGFTSAAVGYAHPYFHAAKRRNCFHPETKLWYRDEGEEWHHGRIEEFVETRLSDPDEDDFGTLVQELDGDVFVPSLDESGGRTHERVEAVSKHRAPDHLIEITTRSGRELTVTPDHEMCRWQDGPDAVTASELEAGDRVPTPARVDAEGQPQRLDLLRELVREGSIANDDLVVRGLGESEIKRLFDEALDEGGYLKPVAESLGVSRSTAYNWVNRDSVPVATFVELYGEEGTVERLPMDVRLGVRRDDVDVDRTVDIDDDVGRLLGYYAAEGFTRREPGNFYQTTVCIPDESARTVVSDAFSRGFGVDAFEENEWKVTVSSRIVSAVFEEVLDAGIGAHDKRVPDVVTRSPTSVLRAFLAGYFAGDGSAASDRIEVRAHTVSDELATDVLAALKRFGVSATRYTERRTVDSGPVAEFYDGDSPEFETNVIKVTSENAATFADAVGFDLERKQETLEGVLEGTELRSQRVFGDGGEALLDEVVSVEVVESDVEHTYCLTVENTNTLVANDLYTKQCDGDEDCVMLLMDGLLNFSKDFLPDKRGGQMDAPLVMSSRIDPSEIDDEAHNMDIARGYDRAFYEATREMADPEEVDVQIAEATLGTDEEYHGFDHTHDTTDIALGPDLSAYKTLGSMMDKMDAQLALSRKLRAVDETDVAERVIEYHFLPDLIGNLRAFSRQETRCLDCGEKYRRMPLTEECRECGGRVNLTVHQGSVNKYMDTAIEVAEKFDCRDYTKQRLEVLERSLKSVFENDKNKASKLEDFM